MRIKMNVTACVWQEFNSTMEAEVCKTEDHVNHNNGNSDSQGMALFPKIQLIGRQTNVLPPTIYIQQIETH